MMIRLSSPAFLGNEKLYLADCIDRGQLSQGDYVLRFEEAFAKLCGTRYALSCSSGTAALHLAMLAMDIGPGDAVIVPALTYVATANAVRYSGASPVFADVDHKTWNITAETVNRAIGRAWREGLNVRGILPVHLYGVPCDMDDLILHCTARKSTWIVEDACQAHGATYKGKRVGSFGAIGCFSFYGNKVLSCGEGGAIVTDNAELYLKMKLFRGQGMDPLRRYQHPIVGYNYRMTEMQGAIALAQVETYELHAKRRREIAIAYAALLTDEVGYQVCDWKVSTSSNWLVTVTLSVNRERVSAYLADAGIETRPAFVPMGEVEAYPASYHPVAHAIGQQGISLPTHVGMSNDEVSFVCEKLAEAIRRAA